VLVLPYGYAYARAEAHTVKEALHRARDGQVLLEDCRGRSAWDRPGQAAELAVRSATAECTADALHVVRTEGAAPRWEVTVAHADGRAWRVTVDQGAAQPPRPESCGVEVLGTPARMEVVGIRALWTAALAG
ncbi:sucrase ferredoxin, partial [Streptomyces eurythermus]